ncbi:serine/threonine-protein phosphatase 6 regulatory ankyrin repeat subunit B-like isoform X2 [Lolium rigidum]|uniref:serine/threonine-protein phosphatase 6 regulatory ankyrin repeat subunit B-like isoform X2 n=1 Tax=Lolium rigidum TaxID=89674 RepID=UPI001F5D4233|nr:serine/threonine-protein phosphatase 6 regulatory ankyrin repeat subunit B-like isoform X2 [Lolium rigidum]
MASAGFAAPFIVGGPVLNMVFQAAFEGNIPLLKSLVNMLDRGRGRPKEAIEALRVEDAGDIEGFTALHVAASGGRLEVCRYLVDELRVDVDCVDKRGRTPLLFLVMCSKDVAHFATAKYLLDHGANPDKASYDWFFPLHYAAGSGDSNMVELLLTKGAYVDPISPVGTPLHAAAAKGQDGAMKILLDHNADYNKKANGKTPLIAAIGARSRECMVLLIKAGADAMGAFTYMTETSDFSNLVSKEFMDCIREDVSANGAVPDDDEPASTKKIRERGFKKLGSYSFKEKDYIAAEASYSMAILFNPDDATLFSNRSLCWLLMGDGGKALADANQCRKLRPDWPKACYRQGTVLMSLKDYEGASERFLDGLKLDPMNAEIEDALREAMESMRTSGSTKAK